MLKSWNMALAIPVVLIIYNRPDLTELVFKEIKKQEPKELFIIADGPKSNFDKHLCKEARYKISKYDWDVKVYKNYADTNLGVAERVSSGLDWVFSEVDRAIILEDDCLPHPSFFRYCEELLNFYNNDPQVMNIAGSNLGQKILTKHSYSFANYSMFWGWATWARAWKKYNHNLDTWMKHSAELKKFVSPSNQTLYEIVSREIHTRKRTWDISWNADIWLNNGVSIIPALNLAKNIGFDNRATFFHDPSSPFSNIPTGAIKFPLVHPTTKSIQAGAVMEAAFFELLPETFPEYLNPIN